MSKPRIGVIGGSGLYQMAAITNVQEQVVETPFGTPSDVIVTGELSGVSVAFLTRHGRGHRFLPSEVPYRANIYALKSLGVDYVIAVSAVGSLQEHMKPLDMVLPSQFIDLTKQRVQSFFGQGAIAHVSLAEPVCLALQSILAEAVRAVKPADVELHVGATYVCIEGPQFSTQAESHWYRSMPADIIGMTNMPEARLAREAEIAYSTLALVTDYDCWHPNEAHVTADMAIMNLMRNAEQAQAVVAKAIELLAASWPASIAHTALDAGLITSPADMAPDVRERLAALIARRL